MPHQYAIKYVQKDPWEPRISTKTERGHESWYDQPTHRYEKLSESVTKYDNINEAYKALLGSYPHYYFFVEEVPC